jgi:hypothetical protein
VADPLYPNPSDDPAGFIVSQQRAAQSSALQGLDANADDGARAIELGKATGTDPSLVYGNLEQFEQQHKASLTSQLLQSNQFLRDYANSHPMAGVVSNDDWGQLDEVSHRVTGLFGPHYGGLLSAPADAVEAGVRGFYQAFTSEGKLGQQFVRDEDAQFASDHPILYSNLVQTAQLLGAPIEILNRTISGVIAGGGAAVESVAKSVGASDDTARQMKEDVASMADVAMQMEMTGQVPHTPEPGAGAVAKQQLAMDVYRAARPFVENGQKPPVGLHEVIDKVYEAQTKQDVKDLDDLTKEAQSSSTRERAPELFEDFVKSHGDASIGVSAEAIRALYGDKLPTPDDNLLGSVPDLAKQLESAEQFGGDVQIPLSTWLAHVEPDVAKALHDDIRVRPGGMTLNETKLEVPERPAPIDSVDAIRRPAGLDPMAAPGQMRLQRVPTEEGDRGHTFDIQDPDGKRIGGATFDEFDDGKVLRVSSIAAGTAEGLPGFLGQRQLTGLLRQLQREFPNAETLEGWRVSGAREQPGMVSIPLRPTPSQLTDFMRSGFEKQIVRGPSGETIGIQPLYSTTVGQSITSDVLSKATDSPVMKAFGEKIHTLTKDVPIHVISQEDIRKVYGGDVQGFHQLYSDGQSNIFLPDDIGYWDPKKVLHIVMHEASHAATVGAIESYPEIKSKIRSLMNEVRKIDDVDEDILRSHAYAFKNEKEFIAEGQSKENFQEALKKVPVSPELMKELGTPATNAWEALKNIVKEIWERITGGKVPQNALDALFKLSDEIFEAQKDVQARGKVGTDFAPPKQLELPGLTRIEDREAFEKAAAIGMTVKQYRQYQELIEKRESQDMELFRAQAERKERARQTAEWKAEEARAREEAKTSLINRPDIAADNLLREGTLFGDKLKGRPRLNSDLLSAEQKSGLPDDYHKSGGVNPDDAAQMFGYHSADAMLQGIKQLHADRGELGPREHINNLAEKITQDHMTREFGNLEQNILEELKDHVISPSQLDILHEELVALGSKFGGELSISKSDIKAWVKKQFSEMPISMHRVDDYLAAAGRSGRGAEQALLDGDGREAFKFKQQQYISMQMANEAKAYEKARASFDKLAKRLAKREITGLPQDYVAHIRDQLLRAQLPIGRSVQTLGEDVREAGDLLQFARRASEGSQVPIFLPDWMYGDWNKKLDTMSAGEFSEYSKGIRQLYNFGRDERKVEVAGDKIDLGEFLDKAKDQLALQGTKDIPYNPSKVGKLIGLAKNIFYGKLIQAETIFNRWDMGNPRGIFNENFMYRAAASANDLSARIKRYSEKVQTAGQMIKGLDLTKPLPNLLKKVTDGLPVNMTVENALRIITDMGNLSNKDKFTRGWKVDPQVLEGWLKANTTKEMWDFAQALGDVHEEMFSELKDMIHSISGVTPDRVPLAPFTDPHGVERRGWYSPMIYDQVQMGTSRRLAGLPQIDPNEITGLMDTGYFKSTTATGAEIQRTGYAAPTDLTLSRLPQRMTQILYDTAFRPFVINFGKVMRDQGFQNAITKHSGVEVRDMMRDWLNDIIGAGKGASTSSDLATGQVVEYFRRNIIGQLIGWNLHTVEKHGLSALVNSMAEVGVGNFAREFQNMILSPNAGKDWDFVLSKSEELQRRRQHWTESLGGQFEAVRLGGQGWRDWMLEKGSSIVAWSDMASAAPSWMAEYKTQMENLAKERPNDLPSDYEGVAISLADRAVRRAHGSTAITSRPGGMRGGAFARTFMSLYGFFNQMLQRNYEVMWRTKYAAENFKQGDYEKGLDNLKRAGVLFATATLWPALVEEMVTPYTNEEKDSWGKWTGKTLALGVSATVPFVREFVHGWINNFETGAGILDTGWKELASTFSDVRKGTKMMDAEHGGKTIKDFNGLVGVATGVTNNEVGNIMKTIWDSTHRSKETPKGVKETAKDLITGHAKERK